MMPGTKLLNLTPQCFVEVLVLTIFWECWQPKPLYPRVLPPHYQNWTTVDHVFSVLLRLGAVTQAQIDMVQYKTGEQEHQRKLYRHCGVTYGGRIMTNHDSWFLCQLRSMKDQKIPLARLVRNLHLELLESGAAKAPLLEEQYRESLSKDAYLTEAAKIATIEGRNT